MCAACWTAPPHAPVMICFWHACLHIRPTSSTAAVPLPSPIHLPLSPLPPPASPCSMSRQMASAPKLSAYEVQSQEWARMSTTLEAAVRELQTQVGKCNNFCLQLRCIKLLPAAPAILLRITQGILITVNLVCTTPALILNAMHNIHMILMIPCLSSTHQYPRLLPGEGAAAQEQHPGSANGQNEGRDRWVHNDQPMGSLHTNVVQGVPKLASTTLRPLDILAGFLNCVHVLATRALDLTAHTGCVPFLCEMCAGPSCKVGAHTHKMCARWVLLHHTKAHTYMHVSTDCRQGWP